MYVELSELDERDDERNQSDEMTEDVEGRGKITTVPKKEEEA